MTRTGGTTRTLAGSVAATVAAALALVVLNSCGSVEQGGGDSTPAPTSTSAASPTGPPQDLTVPPTRAGKQSTVRVKGIVSDGVEPGCRLLTSQGVVYLLMGQQVPPVTGQEVEVEGTVQPDLRTTCQQGKPLVVERVLTP